MKNRDNRDPKQMIDWELKAELKLIREKKSTLSVRQRLLVADMCRARILCPPAPVEH